MAQNNISERDIFNLLVKQIPWNAILDFESSLIWTPQFNLLKTKIKIDLTDF